MATVIMTEEEARLFILFQKHHKFMELMEASGGFNVSGGSVTIHFTNTGEVGSFDVNRRFKVIP